MSESSPTVPEVSVVRSRPVGLSIAAVVCVVLAAVLTVPAVLAYWGQRTLNDTQR